MTEKRVTAKVDSELHKQARLEAVRQGKTLSEIVRDALIAFIGKKGGKTPKT